MVKSKLPPRSGSSLEEVEAVIILKTWGILWGDANKNPVQEKLFHNYLKKWSWSFRKEFFFYHGFLLHIHETAGERRVPSLFLSASYYFHTFINIQTFICIELPSWITISLIVDGILISCLLYDLILDFVTVISTWESRWFELAATITLVLQVDNGL